MKIIFLDLDGVMNTVEFRRAKGLDFYKEIVDQKHFPHLKRIVEQTDATIVLTSSWRQYWNEGYHQRDSAGTTINTAFATAGLQIHAKTPIHDTGHRPDEIRAWLSGKRYIEQYVILDDRDFQWDHDQRAHFVQTEGQSTGLDEATADIAIQVLNGQLLPVSGSKFADGLRRLLTKLSRKLRSRKSDW